MDARPAHERLLDSHEHARRGWFVRAEDRRAYTASHALARMVLGRHIGCAPHDVVFDRTCSRCGAQHGRPRVVADGAPDFSLSHTAGRVVVAVAHGTSVGVDVEPADERLDVDGLASQVLTAAEAEELQRLPRADRARGLLTYWTRKESVLKATGRGLEVPPSEVGTTWSDLPPALAVLPLDPGPGHVASLALLGGPVPLVRELDASALLAT